jgi:hypothetical protein
MGHRQLQCREKCNGVGRLETQPLLTSDVTRDDSFDFLSVKW